MFTGRIRMRVPGIFAPSDSDTPSLGCMVRIELVGPHAERALLLEARCGTGFSVTAISVTLRARRLPVRR